MNEETLEELGVKSVIGRRTGKRWTVAVASADRKASAEGDTFETATEAALVALGGES